MRRSFAIDLCSVMQFASNSLLVFPVSYLAMIKKKASGHLESIPLQDTS